MFFRNKKEEIEDNMVDELPPVSDEDIKKIVKLVETAYDCGASFVLTLILSLDEFIVYSESFDGIKVTNDKKKNKNTLIIKYSNILMSNETHIDFDNIKHVMLDISLKDGEQNV